MLLTPHPIPDDPKDAVTTLQLGPSDCAIVNGYVTESGVSNMPPIHSKVLMLAKRTRDLVGSKADRFGGMK